MQKLGNRQQTPYPPLEHGQVLEMNPHCMKVNYGFKFIRGVFSGLIALVLFSSFVFDIIIGDLWTEYSLFFGFLDDIASFKYWVIPAVLLELYLWPSAPPMIFDRVNRRVIFQVFFRTRILDWDSCEGTIRYFAQATEASATQGYNLRIEGDVINLKPGQKKQRATALIHQSGVSEDLFNYWEYIRSYMDGGPEAVPVPMKLYNRSIFSTPFRVYWAMLPKPAEIWDGICHPESIWTFFAEIFFACFLVIAILATPLVVPLYLMHMLAGRLGRVRRYPKEIRELCKKGRKAALAQTEQPTTTSTSV
ncbi:MAG: hypothetical protein P8Z77_18400 [Candidatus Thiodiazotropha sp.]